MRRITTLIVSLPLLIFAAEWHTLNGPPAGRADDMTMGYDTIIPAWVIYAADHSHKLYKSTNEGNSWYVPTDDEIVNNPVCVLTRSNDAKVVYIGKSAPIPVWWSEDGGINWEERSGSDTATITNTGPLCFAMDSNNSDIIYLGCYGNECAVYKTIDAGETWKPKPLPPSPTNPVVNDIAISGDTILAGCAGGTVQEGIWLSDSGGDNSGASMIEFTITWRNMHL